MSHSHLHNHDSGSNASKNISVAFFLNAFFVVVEIVGGILTNSIAILTDALHDFGDCLSLATVWFLQKKSAKPRDLKYSYGYKRFSLMGTVFLSGVLTVSSIIVVIEAVKRLAAPQEVNAHGMLWIAVAGIIINGAAALRVNRGTSLNERSVFLHIMEDVLGWAGVLVASVVMMFVDFPYLDPILSIAISIWVFINVYKNIRETFKILLQAIPEGVNVDEFKEKILLVKGVLSLHDFHLWSLDGESHVMTLHIVTSDKDIARIKSEVVNIASEYHVVHTTIEFESPDVVCTTNCDDADHLTLTHGGE